MTAVEGSPAARGGEVISLAERLKGQRRDRGISQSQAARELDVARTAYRLWEMEAARPAPDRWRLVATWLGVSMTTLLLAEGLISEEEQTSVDRLRDDGEAAGAAESRDFFAQVQATIDRSIEEGVLTAAEAGQLRAMFDRIKGRSQQP
ncbi:MAG TPA: helix-turn-helix transcriptional regulator [Actinomycetota bacterium]|nr:helix-turn-helix transcriptional regulator [Actinomycetota bacterium]